MDILNMILPIVYIVVGVALIWFVVELALTIRKTRSTVEDMQKQIEPTLANVEQLTSDAKPLVERVSLTVDAANLEIMRVDEILQDVSSITGTASKTVTAVDNVTSAPLDLVSSFTNKVRDKFAPKRASDISKEIGEAKADSCNTTSANTDASADSKEVTTEKPVVSGYVPIDSEEKAEDISVADVSADGALDESE
ncbi:DUF948 domain-containing protein [Adlercreutzia sp. ZJ154]|uniref:DUF948 domain-containing protein n=1 Tax=Adlercreutzia sp. ZJ154 TaxID=2709790 RepID=UPI0013EDE151|nr:DUF948 domain-containing protein [Adlercreutzia sp. ZJ154]